MKKHERIDLLADVRRAHILVQTFGVLLFFALAVLLSQIRIPLPYTPVPLTLQVLAVFLAGYFLAPRLAAYAMILYAVAGMAGLPISPASPGGFLSLAGPTGGYVIGFIPAAWAISFLSQRKLLSRFNWLLTIGAGTAVIYMFGLGHLLFYLNAAAGLTGFQLILTALNVGVLPFILIDITKGAIAASLFHGLMRGEKLIE